MSESFIDPVGSAAVQRLVWRIDRFARELGLNYETMWQIAEGVIADMPSRFEDERVMEARKRLRLAAA